MDAVLVEVGWARVEIATEFDVDFTRPYVNAHPHFARKIMATLSTFCWIVLPHPPYSPDLASSDYWLFSDLQRYLGEKDFKTMKNIQNTRHKTPSLFRLVPSRLLQTRHPQTTPTLATSHR